MARRGGRQRQTGGREGRGEQDGPGTAKEKAEEKQEGPLFYLLFTLYPQPFTHFLLHREIHLEFVGVGALVELDDFSALGSDVGPDEVLVEQPSNLQELAVGLQ